MDKAAEQVNVKTKQINTNYGMRPVSNDDLIAAFGTLRLKF